MDNDKTTVLDNLTDEELIARLNAQDNEIKPPVIELDGDDESSGHEKGTVNPDEPVDAEDPLPEFTMAKASSRAKRWVKMMSSFMKLIFAPVYKKTILQEGDVEKMDAFTKRNAGKNARQMDEALHDDHALWPVANRFEAYMKAVKEIPLDDDEAEMIAEPLSEILYKYKRMQLGPGWMLVIAVCLVMIPRITPMIPDMSHLFQNK